MNRWEQKEDLIEKLSVQNTNLICDRYAYSGVAYSGAKGLDFEWCLNADRGLVKPDLVFYIDLDMDTIKERSGFGDERYEKTEFQEKVREQFLKFRSIYSNGEFGVPEGYDFNKSWINVDGKNKSIE